MLADQHGHAAVLVHHQHRENLSVPDGEDCRLATNEESVEDLGTLAPNAPCRAEQTHEPAAVPRDAPRASLGASLVRVGVRPLAHGMAAIVGAARDASSVAMAATLCEAPGLPRASRTSARPRSI